MTTPNSYFPTNNGTFNADDKLVQPWWIPGWTAQAIAADTQVAASNNLLGPGFPTNLSFVRVTGNYFDGNASGTAGYMTVYMSDNITLTTPTAAFRLTQRLTGTMNQAVPFSYNNYGNGALYLRLGFLDITLFATDQTKAGDTITSDSGDPFTYWVTEHWLGGRQYQITVPSSTAPGPIDINTLIVPGSVIPYKYDPVWPMGNDYEPVEVEYPGALSTIDGGSSQGSYQTPGLWDGGHA